jgi:hypothetical protein
MNKEMYLSKLMALNYLFYEFGNGNLKVTTVLDENGGWTGKVVLEQTLEKPKNDVDLANFYLKVLCSDIIERESE